MLICHLDQTLTLLQPKRRRSSAQPNLGSTSRKTTMSQPVLVEESEPEVTDDVVIRKVGRSKKSVSDHFAYNSTSSELI